MLNKETNGWREGRFTYPTCMSAFPFNIIHIFPCKKKKKCTFSPNLAVNIKINHPLIYPKPDLRVNNGKKQG
jgi:hypothetical protein